MNRSFASRERHSETGQGDSKGYSKINPNSRDPMLTENNGIQDRQKSQ